MPVHNYKFFPPYVHTRKSFNSAGVLTGTLTTNHPTPNNGHHPREKTVYRNWNRTANYKTIRKTQGYLQTLGLLEQTLEVRGEFWSGKIKDPFTQRREEYTNFVTGVPQSVNWAEKGGEALVNSREIAAKTDAKFKVLSNARDLKVNLPVAFYEGRKTVDLIANSAKTLANAYSAFRKGRFKQAARALGIDKPSKTAANHWLAYQYGWRPILSDAVGSATELYDLLHKSGKYMPRRRLASQVRYTGSGTRDGGYCYADPDWYDLYKWDRTVVGQAGLLLEVEYASAAAAASLGVGLTDPLLTLWELIPFSFVFDWFVGVGEWLEVRSSLQGLKVLAGYESAVTAYSGYTQVTYWKGSRTVAEPAIPPWYWDVRQHTRQHWSGSLTTIRTPLYDSLNGSRLTTAAALCRQLTRGDRAPGKYRP